MNMWYVAYIRSRFTGGKKVLIYPSEEPIADRQYICLVKWGDRRVTIEEGVKFNPYAREDEDHLFIGGEGRDDEVEFAVSGKPVIRNGRPVPLDSVVNMFADMRHLFQLPNVNPKNLLFPEDGGRPRYYYGTYWEDDVWFGEKQLLDDWNLQRAAVKVPIVLDRLYAGMGASERQVEGAMKRAGYKPPKDPHSLGPGEWRFVSWDSNLVEVHLKRAVYPWGMVGVDKDGRHVFLMATGGHQGRTGFTLEQVCDMFITATENVGTPVWHALLMDEGNDVFQMVRTERKLVPTVPLRRCQLRACFIFGRT